MFEQEVIDLLNNNLNVAVLDSELLGDFLYSLSVYLKHARKSDKMGGRTDDFLKEHFVVLVNTLRAFEYNDNEIITVVGSDSNTRFMCNNNYKYKKIIITPLVIVALNNDREIKVFGTLVDCAIDYKNYFDVDDIFCTQEEVIVVKGDRKINLFSNEELEGE